MSRRFSLFVVALTLAASNAGWAAPLSPGEEWLGLYILGQKVGYSRMNVQPGRSKGDSLLINSETVIQIALLGQSLEQRVTVNQEATPQGKPLTLEMKMASGGHDTTIRAKYESAGVRCTIINGGTSTVKVVPIPKGVTLELDPELSGRSALKVGESHTVHYFNPANLSIEKATVKALRKEPLALNGITYPATVTSTSTPMGEMTTWTDKDGRTLKVQALMGITMLRQTKEEALSKPSKKYAPPADLAKALAVSSGRELENPRNASLLKIRLTAPSLSDPVKDDRQQVERVDKDSVLLTVSAKTLSPEGSLTIKEAAKAQPEWVKPGPYIQSDNAQAKALAAKILKGETNAFWASQKLRDWVHQNMQVRADIGVIRSGLDVLKDRRGVCRDFAVLYTTLARAAGIPTRIATGLVYNDGDFYYHAWAESYTGKWIDLDPTLPSAFVDATHLKLANGPVESMFSTGKVMGHLKAQVVEYKTGGS